ncbi:MAG TPA: branched-chain amino acid ABC transporter permease [Burkholderiales bacterium]|nr:branched-chain amino acid ABC transporter permease [Burkholderiales bacterium]
MARDWTWFAIGALIALAAAALLTRTVANEYFFFAGYVVLQFVVLATAWNILGGYAGYVNFGSGAFFAMGAYTAVALIRAFEAPLPVQIVAAAAVTGSMGFMVGALTLRLRGIFFSIATVAIAVICETVIVNWGYVGGARGATVLQPEAPAWFASYTRLLFVTMALLAVLAVALARYIETSWIGRGLRAIRDSEEAAESVGVPTLRLKLFAATASGALMGVAGAPFPMYMSFIEPVSAFSLNYAVSALAMPIIGGTASWIGPVIGALLLGSVQQLVTVTISSELNVLVIGVLLVIFVVAAPHGILGLLQRLWGPARPPLAEDRRRKEAGKLSARLPRPFLSARGRRPGRGGKR